uniref:FecR family protein n=1 Tax=Pedobacter schmidteae TaxID=2201271 RepID=UPI000EAECC3A|nr:FecR family protein [Pedobacter schmidteae]
MFEKEFNISLLIALHLRGALTEQQQADLNAWLQASEANRTFFKELINEQNVAAKVMQFNTPDKASIWNKTLQGMAVTQEESSPAESLQEEQTPRVKIYRLTRYVAIAAVLLMVVAAGIILFNKNAALDPAAHVSHAGLVVPGGNKAYLTLADGKVISLTDAGKGQLAEQAGISIRKTADGQVVYQAEKQEADAAGKTNTVTTPRGGQYQIVLPDGTRVWLNAASTLSFPTAFAGLRNRVVELKGEAYFEVAKDKSKPFIVKTSKQQVEVLGTHFNINAYANEENTRTTLLEGSVKVAAMGLLSQSAVLKPNQQAILANNTLTVATVDPEMAIDWKTGNFSFNKESLPAIMRKISRWYDVEIVYQDNYTGNDFTGIVSRKKQVTEVLELLELTGLVHFKIEGRRITVMP